MTFQYACRKPPSGKDLEPAGPVNEPMSQIRRRMAETMSHEL